MGLMYWASEIFIKMKGKLSKLAYIYRIYSTLLPVIDNAMHLIIKWEGTSRHKYTKQIW